MERIGRAGDLDPDMGPSCFWDVGLAIVRQASWLASISLG
jgi:hypothetical protein